VPQNRVRLSDLPEGAVATLADAEVDPETRRLLGSLGLTPSCELRLCKAGEPFIVRVRTTRIGLSRSLAASIYVVRPMNGSA
jgi:Fe2+ transport system protein FeoA